MFKNKVGVYDFEETAPNTNIPPTNILRNVFFMLKTFKLPKLWIKSEMYIT